MTRYLCISVTLLDCLFHGKGDHGEPEWPPSPLRLFQAMLRGARTGCRNPQWTDAKTAAFEWLERCQPPLVVTPQVSRANEYTLFVPNNDSDKKFERQNRLTSKVARPYRLPEEIDHRTLHYLWPINDGNDSSALSHAKLLSDEARHVLALGWGIDQVVATGRILEKSEARALMGIRWQASRRSTVGSHRVPKDGTLCDLQNVYRSFVNSVNGTQYTPPMEPKAFDKVFYLPPTTVPARAVAAFELRRPYNLDRLQAFRQTEANVVAAMLRSVACQAAKHDSHKFPGGSEQYVAGHLGKDSEHTPPRFSYLPLPSIGHEHADGLIRRVLIVEPIGGNGEHVSWAAQRLAGRVLYRLLKKDAGTRKNGGLPEGCHESDQNHPVAVLQPIPLSDRMVRRYCRNHYGGPARCWSSVTPVILPGFGDHRPKPPQEGPTKAERLFLKAIVQAGLPVEAVECFTLRKAPFWPGSQHPDQYRRPDYLDSVRNRRFPGWHVNVRFKEPVPGPLAIGAGRHCGFGLMAGIDE